MVVLFYHLSGSLVKLLPAMLTVQFSQWIKDKTCCHLEVLWFEFLSVSQNMMRNVLQPQMQTVHAVLVSCAPTMSVHAAWKTNASPGRN